MGLHSKRLGAQKRATWIYAFLTAPAVLLVGCDSDEPSANRDGSAQSRGAATDNVLGSVNLPRPDWLPQDFPLPADAHIYLAAVSKTSSPKMFQLQARTMAEKDDIMADVARWAERRGLNPSEEGNGANLPDTFRILSFDGVRFNPSNMQVTDEGGKYRRIILSVVGPPWK
jgi:hypothetical protein